jgi:hypothetical protein
MYRPATVLRLAKALTIAGVSRAKGYILTDAEVLGMKTLQSLVAKRWVVPVPGPSATRLSTARQQSPDGAFVNGLIDTSYMTDSSANNSVKYTPTPTYLNPQVLRDYAQDNIPYALTGTIAGQAAGTVVLNWYAPNNSPSGLTDYSVQYKLSSASSWSTFAHTASTAVTATITGLTSGVLYDFRVAAVISSVTGSYSNTFSIDPN